MFRTNYAAPGAESSLRPSIDAATASDSIHQWYQIIMGFDWKLVRYLIDRFEIGPEHLVLDPFCGSGTTLVQCKKQGIRSVGIDANPVCTLASQVKTTWDIGPKRLSATLESILGELPKVKEDDLLSDGALAYLRHSGMIDRGWLSLHKAKRVMALNTAIARLAMSPAERRFFQLGLMSALVDRIADIKFGPEVYCLEQPKRSHVLPHFVNCIMTMIDDLAKIHSHDSKGARSEVYLGDSRERDMLKGAVSGENITPVIGAVGAHRFPEASMTPFFANPCALRGPDLEIRTDTAA
jgi:hypothetical protein